VADPDSSLDVTITNGRGRAARAPGLSIWLRRVAPRAARGSVCIALVTDSRIRALNRTYRGKDAPTDVLSFPAEDAPSPDMAQAAAFALGDIAIATGVARRQARAEGHSYATELKVLALHGLLHLMGYDHEDPADAGRMARVERRLRVKGGLPSGLIERT
jgi:probable rRNA maturation factor